MCVKIRKLQFEFFSGINDSISDLVFVFNGQQTVKMVDVLFGPSFREVFTGGEGFV